MTTNFAEFLVKDKPEDVMRLAALSQAAYIKFPQDKMTGDVEYSGGKVTFHKIKESYKSSVMKKIFIDSGLSGPIYRSFQVLYSVDQFNAKDKSGVIEIAIRGTDNKLNMALDARTSTAVPPAWMQLIMGSVDNLKPVTPGFLYAHGGFNAVMSGQHVGFGSAAQFVQTGYVNHTLYKLLEIEPPKNSCCDCSRWPFIFDSKFFGCGDYDSDKFFATCMLSSPNPCNPIYYCGYYLDFAVCYPRCCIGTCVPIPHCVCCVPACASCFHKCGCNSTKGRIPDGKEKNVVIRLTGHSLGGALAQIVGLQLAMQGFQVEVCTFGSPKVGEGHYKKFLNQMLTKNARFVNKGDGVTSFPPYLNVPMVNAFGFEHGGSVYKLGVASQDDQSIDEKGTAKKAAGHGVAKYVEALSQVTKIEVKAIKGEEMLRT